MRSILLLLLGVPIPVIIFAGWLFIYFIVCNNPMALPGKEILKESLPDMGSIALC